MPQRHRIEVERPRYRARGDRAVDQRQTVRYATAVQPSHEIDAVPVARERPLGVVVGIAVARQPHAVESHHRGNREMHPRQHRIHAVAVLACHTNRHVGGEHDEVDPHRQRFDGRAYRRYDVGLKGDVADLVIQRKRESHDVRRVDAATLGIVASDRITGTTSRIDDH